MSGQEETRLLYLMENLFGCFYCVRICVLPAPKRTKCMQGPWRPEEGAVMWVLELNFGSLQELHDF